ncbi:MAG: hypothetical protein HOP07_09150 [Bacteriovoracaceae bacterium]|nr:hypothetical protein [Bacteriovoracaceae bacterium]
MKILFVLFLILASGLFDLSASENFNGQFDLENSQFTVNFKYNLVPNQVATYKEIQYFDEFNLPDSNETIPAYCSFVLQFPYTYTIEILDKGTKKIVYFKNGESLINANYYGGFIKDGNCFWNIFDWKKDLSSAQIRITDLNFLLNGKAYRYILDTHLFISSLGVLPNDVIVIKSSSKKNSDGVGDGEVWLDTMPDLKGDYQRTYFRLYK